MGSPQHGIVFDHELIRKALEQCTIPEYGTGRLIPFKLNAEQEQVLAVLCRDQKALAAHPGSRPGWAFIVKSRRVGISTIVDAFDVITTAMHDAAGYFYRTALIWQNKEKAVEQVSLCRRFAQCLGFPLRPNESETTITFPNGSYIEGLSAASKDGAARGSGFNRYHLSELPWWREQARTWASIQGALEGDSSEITIETTIEPDELATKEYARANAYAKLFLPCEGHLDYRADASDLSAEDEQFLRGEGFTIREAMAWALRKCHDGYGGEWIRFFRDFPQLEHHPFQIARGRWFLKVPQITPPRMQTSVAGVTGVTWLVDWFVHPEDTSGWFAIGVDTSLGVGIDHSVVVAVDKVTHKIVACFSNNLVLRDDLARIAAHVRVRLSDPRVRKHGEPLPRMLVETNGPGKTTYNELVAIGEQPIQIVTRTDQDDYNALVETKRMVEAGVAFGPERLMEEANKLHRAVTLDGSTMKKWKGPKDISMALGWCYLDVKTYPPPEHLRPRKEKTAEDLYREAQERYMLSVRSKRRRGGL